MCPNAAYFFQRAPLPTAAPTTDFTSSQRLILPLLDCTLNSDNAESDSKDEVLETCQWGPL